MCDSQKSADSKNMSSLGKTDFGYDPSLALFQKPAVNTGIIRNKWVEHRPISQISNSGLLEFNIDGTSTSYVNLKCSYLQITGKIVKSDGTNTDETDDVSFINLPLQTMWNQIDISLQQKLVNSRVGTNYAYKAYLDVLLNTGPSQMSSQLTSQLFSKNTAGKFDIRTNNAGHLFRLKFTKGSKLLQMTAPLSLDLCQQDRLIVNGVEINLKLWANKTGFYINASNTEEKYYFKITDALLNVCMCEISPAVLLGHAAGLKESPALYPYYQSDVKAYDISAGLRNYSVENIFQGDVPCDMTVGLVSAEAYVGNNEKSPFNFQHFNCNFVGFYVNSDSIPSKPLQPVYSDAKNTSLYSEAYLSLFGKQYNSKENCPIALGEYPDGYCLYKFQINEDNDNEYKDYVSLPRRGHTRLQLQFEKALPESVTLIIYAHFPRTLQIDESRNVLL